MTAPTTEQLDYAERWLSARAVTPTHADDTWYFGELPDPVRIILDQYYGGGDEAVFPDRERAVGAMAVTLAAMLEGAGIPK